MHCWFNGLSWHTNHALLVTAGFITTCLLFHECGKQNFTDVAGQRSYYDYTHAWTKLPMTLKLWAKLLALMSVDYAWPLPEVNSTTVRNLYHLWAACPCLSWSAVALTWAVSAPGFLHADAELWQWPFTMVPTAGTIQGHAFSLREIFKCTNSKFMVYGHKHANKQAYTHICAMQSC